MYGVLKQILLCAFHIDAVSRTPSRMQQFIGWVASAILLLTISTQIYRQWKERSSKGVSRWLFIGQMTASAGFTVYSWLVGDWVFTCTNALMLLSAVVGLGIVLHHRKYQGEHAT